MPMARPRPDLRAAARGRAVAFARVGVVVLVGAGALGVPAVARAGDKDSTWGGTGTIPRARAAYDRGVRANAAGDHATAARAFAEADSLVPEVASLEAALESSMKADDAVLGAELLERGNKRDADPGLTRTMAAARQRFAGRTGVIRIDCADAKSCLASVDGAAVDTSRSVHVKIGPHAVVVQRGGERIEKLVEIAADAIVLVPPRADGSVVIPVPPPVVVQSEGANGAPARGLTAASSSGGISPIWFVVGVGATAVLSGFTLISGLDANAKHDDFTNAGCAIGTIGPRAPDCDARASEGSSAQVRTNVALGVTAALAVATAAIGIWAVRWHDGSSARVGFSGTGAQLEVRTP